MTLKKGNIIKRTQTNNRPNCETANAELTYIVERVNKNTYTLKCIDGYMKNTGCKLAKDFKEENTDVYGTVTKWTLVQ